MSKTDSQIESDANRDQGRSERCGWAVVAGLVIEVILAIVFPAHGLESSDWRLVLIENAAPVLADVLVALGVWGEILFAGRVRKSEEELRRRSNDKVSAAIKDAGKANERAAKAELETQELREQFSWREISPSQEQILRRSLEKLKGSSVHIWVFMQDAETNNFALDLRAIFRLSGWRVSVTLAGYSGNFSYGLIAPMGSGATKDASETIRKAFEYAGLDSWPLSIPQEFMATSVDGNDAILPCAEIYVGPKFPSFSRS